MMALPQPFDQREGEIWFNGAFIPWNDGKIHFLSHALHYASSVFEGTRAYGGKVFCEDAHTDRLLASAEILDMQVPFSAQDITLAQRELLQRNALTDAYIRPLIWRGSEMMAISAQHTKVNLAIAAWVWPSYFSPEEKLKGIKLDWAIYKRPHPETVPFKAKAAGLYMICTLSKHVAEKKGFADAMMLDWEGFVAEATGANVFFVKEGEIHTPRPDNFLDGITRRQVIGLAKKRQIKVTERKIAPGELATFEQCFITGTAAEVTPVSQIGDEHFEVGDITRTLFQDYSDLVRS